MSARRRRALLASIASGIAAAASLTPVAAEDPGPVVAIGGGPRPPELVDEIVRLAGGAEARIFILPMASGVPEETGAYQRRQLEEAGAGSVEVLLVARAGAEAPETAARVAGATGFFFSGGDQRKLADVLVGTRLLEAIAARHRAGAVVAGTSAGAAVLSPSMITGDERLPEGGADGNGATEPFSTIRAGVVDTREGFGFLPGVIVDQHFIARRRQNRLLALVLEHPELLGVGVDESTAVVAEAAGDGCRRLRVVGEGQVLLYDASKAVPLPRDADGDLAASGLVLHVLRSGHRFALCSRTVVP